MLFPHITLVGPKVARQKESCLGLAPVALSVFSGLVTSCSLDWISEISGSSLLIIYITAESGCPTAILPEPLFHL